MQDLTVHVIQCEQAWEDKTANLHSFERLLSDTAPADVIVFPEMFQTGFSMNAVRLAEPMSGESITWLKRQAGRTGAAMVASLMIEENNVYRNRMVFVQPDGLIHHYDKRKLFAFSKEDQFFVAGNSDQILDYKGWKIRLQVCYDLRFPDLAENKVKDGVYRYDLLINVANWPERRSLHWKTLLQARAIENQVYVIGANRVGEGANGLYYSGDSSIIDPAGNILQQVSNDEVTLKATLSLQRLAALRRELPFLQDR